MPRPRGWMHKAVGQHTRNREIAVKGFIVQKAARGDCHNRQIEFLLHLFRHCPRIVSDDAAHAGAADKDSMRMVLLRRIEDARTQTLRRTEHRVALTDAACEERYGRRRCIRARTDQTVKAADILFTHHMCTGAWTVKDNQCSPRVRERPPDSGHTAAALRTPHPRAFYLNCHTAPPSPPVPQPPSVSVPQSIPCKLLT